MQIVSIPIDAIVSCDKAGKLRPIRIKLKSEDESNKVINIKHVIYSNEEKFGKDKIRRFNCKCIINNMERIIELKFDLSSCAWTISKM